MRIRTVLECWKVHQLRYFSSNLKNFFSYLAAGQIILKKLQAPNISSHVIIWSYLVCHLWLLLSHLLMWHFSVGPAKSSTTQRGVKIVSSQASAHRSAESAIKIEPIDDDMDDMLCLSEEQMQAQSDMA